MGYINRVDNPEHFTDDKCQTTKPSPAKIFQLAKAHGAYDNELFRFTKQELLNFINDLI